MNLNFEIKYIYKFNLQQIRLLFLLEIFSKFQSFIFKKKLKIILKSIFIIIKNIVKKYFNLIYFFQYISILQKFADFIFHKISNDFQELKKRNKI